VSVSPPSILAVWPPRRGSLLGFASVQFASGLVIHEVTVHRAGSKTWCGPPSRPWVRDGVVVVDEITCRPKYQPVIEFATHGVRAAWSRQILEALATQHPDALREDAV
jgi:hypothetical protein